MGEGILVKKSEQKIKAIMVKKVNSSNFREGEVKVFLNS